MTSPLRPNLYNRLLRKKHIFGEVKIANPGQNMIIVRNDDSSDCNIISRGEAYRVNCPFCNDRRGRLWINHCWGYRDPITGKSNLWLSICYNENCLNDPINRQSLYSMVFDDFGPEDDKDFIVNYSDKDNSQLELNNLKEVSLPGTVIPLDELSDSHPAVQYLTERNFDVKILSKIFSVGFCLKSDENYFFANNRIIIPIYMNNVLVGWQARLIGDNKYKGCPKYLTMPGFRKSQVLYNFDIAKNYPFVVVTEGVSDVWRFGPEAVAVFGHDISPQQRHLLLNNWKKIILLFDGDIKDKIYAIIDKIIPRFVATDVEVIPLLLPDDKDPADLSSYYLRDFVFKNCNFLHANQQFTEVETNHV